MSPLSDRRYVQQQYEQSGNFDARVRLYSRYAQSPVSWHDWLFERLELGEGERVLDVGCGPGGLWSANGGRLPPDLDVTLADQSAGMLAQARERLAGVAGSWSRIRCDAQRLPLRDGAFDTVLANHMLYHLADRSSGLAEMRRVLRAGGRLCVGTNDWTHLIELRELIHRFGVASEMRPPVREPEQFDLETAAEEIGDIFGHVELHRRSDTLEVTSSDDFMDYVDSIRRGQDEAAMRALEAHVRAQIERMGSVHLSASVGLLVARA